MMKKIANRTLVILLAISAWAGPRPQATVSASASAGAGDSNLPTFSQRYPRYELRPGDVFDLSFEYTPEFNQTVTVQPDGFVSLLNAGEIRVSGLTVPQVREAMAGVYGKILFRPMISVLLKEFDKPYFIVDGQVSRPGKYDLRGDTTVVQAIAIAGGFNNAAKHSQVVLFRRVNDNWTEARLLDVKKMEKQRNLSEDLHLRPGDMIFVAKNRISKIQQYLPNYGMGVNMVTPR